MVDLNFLRLIARGGLDPRGFRGRTLPDLVTEAQGLKGWQDDDDWLGDPEQRKVFCETRLAAIIKELHRREDIKARYGQPAHPHVIQALKETIPIADILERYTEVFYSNRDQWKFRCNLHGEDRTPSGVICNNEKRWYCYGCNVGGDIIDALQIYGRMDIREAIRELCSIAGLEPQLIPQKPKENQEPQEDSIPIDIHALPPKRTRKYTFDIVGET